MGRSNSTESKKSSISTKRTRSTLSSKSNSRSLKAIPNGLGKNWFWRQLFALIYKNFLLHQNRYIVTILEIGLLILFLTGVYETFKDTSMFNNVSKSNYSEPVYHNNPTFVINFNSKDFEGGTRRSEEKIYPLYYAPNNDFTTKMVRLLRQSGLELVSFEDKDSLYKAFINSSATIKEKPGEYEKLDRFAVYFEPNSNNGTGPLLYEIRKPVRKYGLKIVDSPFPAKTNQNPYESNKLINVYSTFMRISAHINRAYIETFCKKDSSCALLHNTIAVNQMPYPAYKDSSKSSISSSLIELCSYAIILGFIFNCQQIAKRITDEKTTKARELLRMFGTSDLVYWLSHFITNWIILFIQAIIIAIIVFYSHYFKYSSISLLFCFHLIYCIQFILFSMLITTVFNRPTLAGIAAMAAIFGSFFLLIVKLLPLIQQTDVVASNTARYFSCFLPTGSVIWFYAIVAGFELSNIGFTWNTLFAENPVYQKFNGFAVLSAMCMSIPLYVFIIWYIDSTWPFQHGIPKSPLFLLKSSYWRPGKVLDSEVEVECAKTDSKMFEKEPVNLEKMIRIKNVKKVFRGMAGTLKVAVKNLSLNIYQNEITVLLGHNGAGKSTTMNMITGMFNTSAGSIHVNRFNINTQTTSARRSMGLCPQENIFFNELTVYQHLKLFAKLKGIRSSIKQEIFKTLEMLKLGDKANVRAKCLSGGMMRKLQLAIALIGGTQILILDEPTSGLDPEARRVIWDSLLSIRRNRTILLTTHFMEEADILGDRIAIMNEGYLSCYGSPMFLKNRLGGGYMLRVAKKDKFKSGDFERVVKHFVRTASLYSEIETEVIYNLGILNSVSEKVETNSDESTNKDGKDSSKKKSKALANLFDEMEKNKEEYGIDSYGMAYTTLEDVFLQVGADIETKIKPNHSEGNEESDSILRLIKKDHLATGRKLFKSQMKGLLLKRFHFARRYWPMVVLQVLIPNLIIYLAFRFNQSIQSKNEILIKDVIKELNLLKIYGSNTKPFYYGNPDYFKAYEELNLKKYKATTFNLQNISITKVLEKWIIEKGTASLNDFIHQYIYGLGVEKDRFNVWFNSEQYHSIPLSIIALQETLLHSVIDQSLKEKIYINVTNHPLFASDETKDDDLIGANGFLFFTLFSQGWFVSCLVMIPIAFPFLAASFILLPLKEKVCKIKLIQLMSGLSYSTYWLSNFIFDLFTHLISIIIVIFIMYLFDSGGVIFNNKGYTGFAVFLLLFAYGLASIPSIYLMTFMFDKPSTGFTNSFLFYFLFGFIFNMVISIQQFCIRFGMFNKIHEFWFFILFPLRFEPIFALLYGFQKIFQEGSLAKICDSMKEKLEIMCANPNIDKMIIICCPGKCGTDCLEAKNPFAMNSRGSGIELLFLIFTGLFRFWFLIRFENNKSYFINLWNRWKCPALCKCLRCFFCCCCCCCQNNATFQENETNNDEDITKIKNDSDVDNERERIEALLDKQPDDLPDLLTVSKLTKKFGNFVAVNELTFGVHHQECFGLLGVNGAGKTTTFSMLIGELAPNGGNAWMEDGKVSLLKCTQKMQKNIGYCPQFDALLENLTGRETLELFSRLRGVPADLMKRDINNLVSMIGLESHVNSRTENYSGGNKRKLSVAIAMIGIPSVLFLDEPTSGVDPAARRQIWTLLGHIKRNLKSSIVLTSHSMDECEALCSRIAIMVNGRFRCFGSTQHLRQKFCQGFSVKISLRKNLKSDSDYIKKVKDDVMNCFPSAELKDFHQSTMDYRIHDKKQNWSCVFREMANLGKKHHFEDYVVSGTSLEQIFIMFAKAQKKENMRKLIKKQPASKAIKSKLSSTISLESTTGSTLGKKKSRRIKKRSKSKSKSESIE